MSARSRVRRFFVVPRMSWGGLVIILIADELLHWIVGRFT